MTSTIIAIADAVVQLIAAGEFGKAFEVERSYLPSHTLDELADLRVLVVPDTVEVSVQSRSTRALEVSVKVGVQQRLEGDGEAARERADALLSLAEEIIDHLSFRDLDEHNAVWTGIEHDPVVSFQDLDRSRVLLSIMTVSYLVSK